MPFFDFHCHPAIKPQFSDPLLKPVPWQNINAQLKFFKNWSVRINTLFNEVLDSQACVAQLGAADVKLIGLILHAPEKKIAEALGAQSIVNKGKVNLISKKQLGYLAEGTHSFELIQTELQSLLPPASNGQQPVVKILRRATDFKEQQSNIVFAVLIIEGLHCFFSDPFAANAKKVFTQNFKQFTTAHTVLAINLCHMQQNDFCNHAHGIQFFTPALFYPVRKGISQWGTEVVQMMIDRKILVDIKHMSLKARWELYTWFKKDDGTYIQPIICTHAGVTGLSIADRVKYLLNKPIDKGLVYELQYLKPQSKHDPGAYYNCSSINLYDEDIEHILLSGGMVGISFDQRILGFADESVMPGLTVPHDIEYISHLEANFFLGPNPALLPVYKSDKGVWAAEDLEDLDPSLGIEMHRRFLINTIVHILWVAHKHAAIDIKTAAKQICLGTDFDGLINAIDCCKTVAGFGNLKHDMQEELSALLKKVGIELDAATLLDGIFYSNGKDFVLGRLAAMAT